jgi:hypothetical protein
MAAKTQQGERMRRVGVFIGRSEEDPEGQEWSVLSQEIRFLSGLAWVIPVLQIHAPLSSPWEV